MICVVDYGVGNIHAFLTRYKRIGIDARRARSAEDLAGASHLILPGVGHFDSAMQRLNASGMRPALETMVLRQGVPILGVCVGMQMLAAGSDEGSLQGLNWIPGRVRAFATNPLSGELPMLHMGWNSLNVASGARLFSEGFDHSVRFYFLHSFYFDAEDKADVAATAQYGLDFAAVVNRGHVYGVQFHPEKSHKYGVSLIRSFINDK